MWPRFGGGSVGWVSGRRLIYPAAIVARAEAVMEADRVQGPEVGEGNGFVRQHGQNPPTPAARMKV